MSNMSGYAGTTGRNIIPKGYDLGNIGQFTPQQMDLFKQLFSQVGPQSYLGQLASGDQGVYEQMEAPAMRQFAQLQGNIASRFSGQGLGGRKSSAFQNAQSSAASDFAQQLASQRQQLQRQAISDLFGLSGQLLGQRPYEQFLIQQQFEEEGPNFLQKLLGGAAPVAGGLLGGFLGGPLGASAGSGIGSAFANAFR